MNLDFARMCGKHTPIYDAYYKQIDPKGTGTIEAFTAAKFLKKSGLSDVVLSRVWDLSDPAGRGFLDKQGFLVALKLVSLAQAGQVANMDNIYIETPNPPKLGDLPKIVPQRIQASPVPSASVGAVAMPSGDWSISVIDRLKYEQQFEALKPVGGMLPGNKVKGVLLESKLPMDTLGKIWDLADQDKDGNLDKHEFIVAMHLVQQIIKKRPVPAVLPPELRKPGASGQGPPRPVVPRAVSGEGFGDAGFVANFPKDIAPPPAVPIIPAVPPPMQRVPPVGGPQPLISTDPLIPIGAPPSVTANADWVVTPDELIRFEIMFRESDRDKDGLVSGLEVKNIFIQSGVPQQCLAHIWALCDTNQSGKLTLEQFALAMWMVERKKRGIEPPQVLTANMVPPSMRGIVSGVDVQPQVEPKPTYTNPELEMISNEIEELAKERRAIEAEISQKEADIRIKAGEVRSLQTELDTLTATLKQLENQRGEAQKRLDDLQAQVNKIRDQCQKQEETINEQEGELNAKRAELQKLKDEEAALQNDFEQNNRELQRLTQTLSNTQLQINSVRSMVTQLLEHQRQMTDALLLCRAAIESNNGDIVSEYQLKIEPDLYEAQKILDKKVEDRQTEADPFDNAKPSNGLTTNGFGGDAFGGRGSGSGSTMPTNTMHSGFDDSFTASSGFDSGFDAFGTSSSFGQQRDPFGGDAFSATNKPSAVTPEPGKDDFGSDPFAALHAPTGQGQILSPNAQKSGPPPRPESPSPALPPKKSKVPPPRPAPPRPSQGPARPGMDGFGSTSTSGGFADFDDFDNKVQATSLIDNSRSWLDELTCNIKSTASTTSTPTAITTSPTPPFIMPLTSSTSIFSSTSTSSLVQATASYTNSNTSTITTTFTTTTTSTTTTFSSSTNNTNNKESKNNHSTRSITPLQQAVSVFNSSTLPARSNISKEATFDSSAGTTLTLDRPNTKTPIISGPTEFSDDPFKDYRYEDPFSIKDPFDDDGDALDVNNPEQLFKDTFSDTEDELKVMQAPSSKFSSSPFSSSNKGTLVVSLKTPMQSSNEFLDGFDAFNLNPSPATSQHSATSGGVNARRSSTSSSHKSQGYAPLTPKFGTSATLDNFADFDAFGANSNNNNNNNNSNNTRSTEVNKTPSNDSFFDAFNDNFDTNSKTVPKATTNAFDTTTLDAFGAPINVKKKDNTKISKSALNTPFDAFSINPITTTTPTTQSAKIFDAFNDNNFEDDFFQSKTNKTTTVTPTTKDNLNNKFGVMSSSSSTLDNFANFDAFSDNSFQTTLNNSNRQDNYGSIAKTSKSLNASRIKNQTTLTKIPNKNSTGADADAAIIKIPEKFTEDYSKPESFEDDLSEALRRSMVDQ